MYQTGAYPNLRPKVKKSKTNHLLFAASSLLIALLVGFYLLNTLQQIQPGPSIPVVKVLVAATDIPLGKALTAEDVKLIDWPKENSPYRVYSSIDQVVGRVALRPLIQGEAISDKRLAPIEAGQGLGALIPRGMRAQALRVNEQSGVAGFVKPGDFVDIVSILQEEQGLISRIALQNVQVLAVGEQFQSGAKSENNKAPVVTVLLRPEQAERLAIASTNGQTVLTLRNGYDPEEVASLGFSGANVEVLPSEIKSTTEEPAQPEPKPGKGKPNAHTTKKPDETNPTVVIDKKPDEPSMPQIIVGGKIVTDGKKNKNKIVIIPMAGS